MLRLQHSLEPEGERVLVYQATKLEFMDDVDNDAIVGKIQEAFERRIHRAQWREVLSWRNSLQYMYKVLNTDKIPGACGVAVSSRYRIPTSASTSC